MLNQVTVAHASTCHRDGLPGSSLIIMAKRDKKVRGPKRGRVTPKANTPPPSSRYTPPTPKVIKSPSRLAPILMFGFFGLGLLTIMLNYFGLLPGDTSNGVLVVGLAFITAGFVAATQFR